MKRMLLALLAMILPFPALAELGFSQAPAIRYARGEHQRVVLSFAPVAGATSYEVRYRSEGGSQTTIPNVLVTDYAVHGLNNGTSYRFEVAAHGPGGKTPFSPSVTATPTPEMSWDALAEAFAGDNPTRSACPFWMLHGNESDEELRAYLDVVYRFGFEGVTLHPYNFEDYLGAGQWRRWRVIVEHARKLGLVLWQQDDRDYPSGYAGGKIVREDRTLARWEVALSHRQRVQGPGTVSVDVSSVLPPHHRFVSISAFGPDRQVKDLADRVSDHRLRWTAPPGRWEVFVTQPGSPESTAPELIPTSSMEKSEAILIRSASRLPIFM